MTTRVNAILIGDSVAYGSQGPGVDLVNERLAVTPCQNLNNSQSLFYFGTDYSTPGASFAKLLSGDATQRLSAGMPMGLSLQSVLQSSAAQAVLICLGGNDSEWASSVPAYVESVASICAAAGKIFAFVGVVPVNANHSATYSGNQANYPIFLSRSMQIAAVDEAIRQTAIRKGYAYVDVRNLVPVTDWAGLSGDLIHPAQAYSTKMFSFVGKAIAGEL